MTRPHDLSRHTPLPVRASMLRQSSLFQDMDGDTVLRLAAELPGRTAEPGEVLISEGDLASDMFLVVTGECEVVKATSEGAQVRVALLGPGDWCGEMAVLGTQPRSATVRVVAPSTVVQIGEKAIKRLLAHGNPQQYTIFLANIAKGLSRRLRVADGLIAQSSAAMARKYVEQSRRKFSGD